MIAKLQSTIGKIDFWIQLAQPGVILLLRCLTGFIFARAGWYKITHLDQTIGFFASLGLPVANALAPLVATLEFFGGLFLIAGFATRLVCLPLLSTMLVALFTAHSSSLGNINQMLEQPPVVLIFACLGLIAVGAGKWSTDTWLLKYNLKRVPLPMAKHDSQKKSA